MANRVRRRLLAAGCAGAGLIAAGRAWPQGAGDALMRAPRRALIVGNGRYRANPLRNPVNDARALGEQLKRIGFDTSIVLDADRAGLQQAVSRYAAEIEKAKAVGVFYFAGHGLQVAWRNYLVPVDAHIERIDDVQARCVDLGAVLDGMRRAKNPMNVVILDACRDNPFGADVRLEQKGLSQFDAPHGTFLAYATAPGNVASDGAGEHGLYTEHLLREIAVPQARIEDVFKRVRLGVRRGSNGLQIPWESTSLEEDFYFVRPPELQKLVDEEAARERRKAELAEWQRIRESRNPEDFYAFLQRYPNGPASEQAQFRLDQLQKPQVVAQAGPDRVQPLASGESRYQVGDTFVYDIIDRFTRAARRTGRIRVTQADSERVVFSDGTIRDQMGSVMKNANGTHTPGIVNAPSDVAIGKRWRSNWTTVTPSDVVEQTYMDFRVVAIEEVTVPAGRIWAYRIEARGEAHGPRHMTSLRTTSWLDPATMIYVKSEREYRMGARIHTYDTVELVEYKRAPR